MMITNRIDWRFGIYTEVIINTIQTIHTPLYIYRKKSLRLLSLFRKNGKIN